MRRDAPTSLYAQIAGVLRSDIAAARFEPTGRLPSEETLRTRFGVSRVTVRLALAELEADGLLDRQKGKGTFTRGKQVRHALDTLQSFHEALQAQGFQARIEFLHAELDSSASVDGLGLRVSRLHVADGSPIALGVSQVPSKLAEQDWRGLNERPLYAIIETVLNVVLTRAEFSIGLGRADGNMANLLGVEIQQPLLMLKRLSFLDDDNCLDRSTFYIRPDMYQFTVSSRL